MSEGCLVDVNGLATVLGVKPNTIYYWASRGEIPVAIRTGRVLRFDPAEVKAELARRAQERGPGCGAPPLLIHRPRVDGSLTTRTAGRASNRKEMKYGDQ